MMKFLVMASVALFLMIGVYSPASALHFSPETSSSNSQGPWLFAGAYENYTINGNYSYFGNTYKITGYMNTTVIQFNCTDKSIERNEKGIIAIDGQASSQNSYSNNSFSSFSTAVNDSVLSDLNKGNMSYFNNSGNSNVKDTMNVPINTNFGNLQSDLINLTNSYGHLSFYIDSQNGVMLKEIVNSTSIYETQSINSTNVPMTQNAPFSLTLPLSTGEIYEIVGIAAVIVAMGAMLGFKMKKAK
jgi:hypothetical protein